MAQRSGDTPEAVGPVARHDSEPLASKGVDLDGRLRGWLGVDDHADDAQVADVHRQLRDYLADAPPALRAWAAHEAAAADAAHAVLTGAAAAPTGSPGSPAADSPARTTGSSVAPTQETPASPSADLGDFGELGDEDGLEEIKARSADGLRPAPGSTARRGGRSPLAVLALLAIVAAVVVGVYQLGDRGPATNTGTGSPRSAATSNGAGSGSGADAGAAAAMPGSTPTPADPARVAALTKKVQDNPKDTAAMRDLSNLYMQAADYANAATWQRKVLQVDPKDTDAMLALGASQFNTGDLAAAEKQWRAALAIDPKKAEAHYDLGFLYLSQNPPQLDAARAEWAKVSELAPGSDLAQTAQAHLERLERAATMTTTPTPTPGSSGGGQ